MMFIEKYRFSYLDNIDVGRKEIQIFYNKYSDTIPLVPEKFTFSVIDLPFITSKESKQKTYFFLDSLKKLIMNNIQTFDYYAKQYSDDPGTASSGGFLGFTDRGTLVSNFEKTAYSLKIGEISLPIQTEFGYHLIKLMKEKNCKGVDSINAQINESKISSDNVVEQLKILKEMYDAGDLTKKEYEKAKKKVLK